MSSSFVCFPGDILQKKADMAVAGMIRNYERELVVDFTASYMDYGVSILISKPQKHNNVFAFLEPLTVQVTLHMVRRRAKYLINYNPSSSLFSKQNYYRLQVFSTSELDSYTPNSIFSSSLII